MSATPATAAGASVAGPGPVAIALAGAIALAVAMGIGRFAFTPLLPMMLADGSVDLHQASWLASANYLGYLAGALLCTVQPWVWSRLGRRKPIDGPAMVRLGLAATVLLTLSMAAPLPSAWPTLRFAAGVASALVFVYSSGWCLTSLARLGFGPMGGAIYTGPGIGIVLTGLMVSGMVALHWHATGGWLTFGALGLLLSAAVWRVFRGTPGSDQPGRAGTPGAVAPEPAGATHGRTEIGGLALAYGLAGFGYIVTATFLPVIARSALPGSAWLDLFWPIFGLGVFTGALLSTRLRLSGDLRRFLALAYAVQALGIATSLWSPTLAGFAIGSLLLGLPFTAITYFAMQEVRRIRPAHPASLMGLLTAAYGLGQIVGPPMTARLLRGAASQSAGFSLALEIAASALLLGAAMFTLLAKAFPKA
jgi:predicted MFS family arabinose efflux permease